MSLIVGRRSAKINLEQVNQYKMSEWLSSSEALARLSLKPQTLYAYVSRGLIAMRPDGADARKSLYRAADVERLEALKRRGRRRATIAEDAIAWGEPVLTSALTAVAGGRLFYRGRDAVELARTARLEDVARLLWNCGDAKFPRVDGPARSGPLFGRLLAALAERASVEPPAADRSERALYFEAAATLDALVDAASGSSGDGPIHERLAKAWRVPSGGLRRALALLADHELNASTFAARVAASTGASIAASALAGLCALSGPAHGGVTRRVYALAAAARRNGPESALRAAIAGQGTAPGFGHPLYPEGDPRARALLADLAQPAIYQGLGEAAESIGGPPPNVDFALVALCESLSLPEDAAFAIFAVARSVGWIAHALEQRRDGRLIRPRARYVGPAVELA